MAPEQIEKPSTVDHRADIYSLGVVFYEMLTGELPLGKFQPPSQKVQVDVRLDEVVLHALEKEPSRRYQQISEVKTDVDKITSTPPPATPGNAGMKASASTSQKPDRFWRRFATTTALVILAMILIPIALVFLALVVPANFRARAQREEAVHAETAAAAVKALTTNQLQPAPSLVIQSEQFKPANPETNQLDWGFKFFVPPNQLATFLFVSWSNGIPAVDPGFSTYFKVGKAGGIDIPFCSVSCYRESESYQFSQMSESLRPQFLAGWRYPESAGASNAVHWNVDLGANSTAGALRAMPLYHRVETTLPQSVNSGRQLRFPLIEFERPANSPSNGWSGVDLRIFLDPLELPPIRMLPNEIDMTNYVAARGLLESMDEALSRIKDAPVEG